MALHFNIEIEIREALLMVPHLLSVPPDPLVQLNLAIQIVQASALNKIFDELLTISTTTSSNLS